MISIIIASNREALFKRIKENIAATVGVAHEVIRIKEVEEGLCAAYNKGASFAQHPYLCFVHDDVLFHTSLWGEKIVSRLTDSKTGVIGVMGGRYKAAAGLGWRDGRTSFYRYNMNDGLAEGKRLFYNPANEMRSKVLCLDGAFLCCRKEVWQDFKFDETSFTGFHFYDIDFSFRVARQFKNFVVYDVLLEHFSHGKFDNDFLSASLVFDKVHRKGLPCMLESLSKKEIRHLEGYALSEKLRLLKKNSFPLSLRFKLLTAYSFRYRNLYQFVRNLYFGFIKG